MNDDSELTESVLTGECFEEQPACWQTMVNILRNKGDPYFNNTFDRTINEYLSQWGLKFVRNDILGLKNKGMKIVGNRNNITAWMLAHE